MGKKKKHAVRKMTEEDYNNYVMSLKEERPTRVVLSPDEKGEGKREKQ